MFCVVFYCFVQGSEIRSEISQEIQIIIKECNGNIEWLVVKYEMAPNRSPLLKQGVDDFAARICGIV